jgi:hypothetical protein
MKRIRIAICDDDSIGRGLLQESLEYLLQENNLQADISSYCSGQELLREQNRYDIIHFLRREMLDFTAFPVFFVSNLLLVQRKKYYFNRATVSRNCSIVL